MTTDPIVEFLAAQPGTPRLLAEHVDDGTGHCTTCSAGPQAGRRTWPCRIHDLARVASEQRGVVQA